MSYTSAERIGIKRGIEQSLPSLHRVIANIVIYRFGENGRRLAERISEVRDLRSLEIFVEKLFNTQNISEAEKIFDEIELPSFDELEFQSEGMAIK